jgi:hypothetical protein
MKSPVFDAVTLSAGPDGIVESAFERDGLPTAGDDIVSLTDAFGRPYTGASSGHVRSAGPGRFVLRDRGR